MSAGNPYSYLLEPQARAAAADLPARFLAAFQAVLERTSYGLTLDHWARTAARCGRCAERCQLYQATAEDRDLPCARSELLLAVYRRYFTVGGRLRGRLPGAFRLTQAHLDRLAEDAYRCTACRRCRSACPHGIDHGLLTHLARWLLAEAGVAPKALVVAVREQLAGVGNTSAIPVPAMKDTVEFLAEDFQDVYGKEVRFPVDEAGAEYVFFPAVSDYLLEPDTLMGNAAVLHFSGDSWTIGTGNFDGINYGLFISDRVLERVVRNLTAEVRRLGARKILVGECGHATRSAWFTPAFAGPGAPPVVSCLQHTCAALRAGRLPIRPGAIEERVTYHDPCNIAREGRITEEPREILKAVCREFVEMTPNRQDNYCCGGGGGLVSLDEIRAFRTGPLGRRKAEQIRATGARFVVAPCANCKKQLRELCQDNGLEGVEVVGLHDLVLKSLDYGKKDQGGGGGALA